MRYAAAVVVVALALPAGLRAQQPRSARDSAAIDITGYWVSYVTENWRYRMVTPAKGEYRRIPSSRAALPIINAWDPAADDRAGLQCKSYGAGNIMSVPGRLHISWQDADTLKIETDAGMQTRLFHFSRGPSTASASTRSWQGDSTAAWEPAAGGAYTAKRNRLKTSPRPKRGNPAKAGLSAGRGKAERIG